MTTAPRVDVTAHAAEAYQALVQVHRTVRRQVDASLAELVMIRASQLNHCAYCLDMHVRDARRAGESDERIFLLNAWEEAEGVYSDRERAALALTEAVTVLTDGFVPDAVYERAARYFDATEMAHLVFLTTTINALNRLHVTARTRPAR